MRKDPYSMSINLNDLEIGYSLYSQEQLVDMFRAENPDVSGFVETVQSRIHNGFLEATFIVVNE